MNQRNEALVFMQKKLKDVREMFAQQEIEADDSARELIIRTVFDDRGAEAFSLSQIEDIIQKIFLKTRRKLNILEPLLGDAQITEIMVNGPQHIFVEKAGKLQRLPMQFDSTEELEEVIRTIVGEVHREINEMHPIVDARLADGSRVNAVYKNVAVNGPVLTIRKFSSRFLHLADLVGNHTMTGEAAELLRVLVGCGYNIFVSGGTSSGKTTLLNALAEAIPLQERVIVVEDSMELKMHEIENIVHMECRSSNASGKGSVSMTDLIRSSLRMRPDRLIIGEVRGDEVVDMLNGMNTGHAGMSTGHGNSAAGMLKRLESMYLMALPLSVDAIRAQIAEGIDILVHVERLEGGIRRITEITELLDYADGSFKMNPLMRLNGENELIHCENFLQNTIKAYRKGAAYVSGLHALSFIP